MLRFSIAVVVAGVGAFALTPCLAQPGDPLNGPIAPSPSTPYPLDVFSVSANPVGDFVVSWQGSPSQFAVGYKAAGEPQSPPFVIAPYAPAIALDASGNITAAWLALSNLYMARRYTLAGQPLTPTITVADENHLTTTRCHEVCGPFCHHPSVGSAADGRFVVAWDCQADYLLYNANQPSPAYWWATLAYYRTFSATAQPTSAERQLDDGTNLVSNFALMQLPDETPTQLGVRADGSFVAGFGNATRHFAPSGLPLGLDTGRQGNNFTMSTIGTRAQQSYVAAWEEGDWASNQFRFHVQAYDGLDRAQGPEIQLPYAFSGYPVPLTMAADPQGNYAIVHWGSAGVSAQFYAFDGMARTGLLQLPLGGAYPLPGQPGSLNAAVAAMDGAGNLVLAYELCSQDPNPTPLSTSYTCQLYVQRFEGAGS